MWILSPRQAIESFIHAAELPAEAWVSYRGVALPGLSVTIQEMVDSLREVAGPTVVDRIAWEPDPFIEKLVYGWPVDFEPSHPKMGILVKEVSEQASLRLSRKG